MQSYGTTNPINRRLTSAGDYIFAFKITSMKLIELIWIGTTLQEAREVEFKNDKFALKLVKQHESNPINPRYILPEMLPRFNFKPVAPAPAPEPVAVAETPATPADETPAQKAPKKAKN